MRKRKFLRQVWTAEETAILLRLYPDSLTAEIARALGRSIDKVFSKAQKLSLHKSEKFMSELGGRFLRGHRGSPATEFKKGHSPHNKGLRRPGWSCGRMRETQFRKGQRPQNYLPVGTIKANSDGYLVVKIADGPGGFGNQKVWAFVHRRVWEAAHGPIPPGHRIWWKDRDHNNCAVENLELLSAQEHMARTSIHNLPAPLKQVILLNGALKRKIRRQERNGEEQNL